MYIYVRVYIYILISEFIVFWIVLVSWRVGKHSTSILAKNDLKFFQLLINVAARVVIDC